MRDEYKGSFKKVSNFDVYWDEKIKFIKKIPLQYEIRKRSFSQFNNIEYYDLYFTSFDGAKIYAKYLKPTSENKKVPLLFHFHGYPGASRNWFEKSAYCALGYAVLAIDFRGQGGKSEDIGGIKGTTVAGHVVAGIDDKVDNMLYVKNIMDMMLLVRIGKQLEDIDVNNLNCIGGSQGGAFSIICAALNEDIKKCITLYPFLSDFKKVYDMDLDLEAYEGLRYYSRWYNQTGEHDEQFFERLSYIDTKNFAGRVKAEVLFGMSKIDKVCPIETQYAVYNNMNCKKRNIVYKKYAHENIPHFNDEVMHFLLEGE